MSSRLVPDDEKVEAIFWSIFALGLGVASVGGLVGPVEAIQLAIGILSVVTILSGGSQ